MRSVVGDRVPVIAHKDCPLSVGRPLLQSLRPAERMHLCEWLHGRLRKRDRSVNCPAGFGYIEHVPAAVFREISNAPVAVWLPSRLIHPY